MLHAPAGKQLHRSVPCMEADEMPVVNSICRRTGMCCPYLKAPNMTSVHIGGLLQSMSRQSQMLHNCKALNGRTKELLHVPPEPSGEMMV